jgi:hypothetical protein
MLIADSVVPWASEWLFFYEIWLPSGEWHGGGEWPPPRASDFKDGAVAVGRAQRRRAG